MEDWQRNTSRNGKPPHWPSHPPQEHKIPGSNPACTKIFSGMSHTSGLKIGTPVATLPGAWRYRVSTDRLARCQYTLTG